MITRAQDYLYIKPKPIAAGIHGKILPNVAGTAESCVNRYEDIAYLVEMARERRHWELGDLIWTGTATDLADAAANIVPHYDPTGVVSDRRTIEELCEVAHRIENGYFIDLRSWLIHANWSDRDVRYPLVVKMDDGYALGAWRRQIPSVPITCPGPSDDVPYISESTTLAKLFSDFASMKRWLFFVGDVVAASTFASGQDRSATGHTDEFGQHTSALVVSDIGGELAPSDPTAAPKPAVEWSHEKKYNIDTQQWYWEDTTERLDCQVVVYVKKPFVYDRLTDAIMWGKFQMYASCNVSVYYYDEAAGYYVIEYATAVAPFTSLQSLNRLNRVTDAILREEYDASFSQPFNSLGWDDVCSSVKTAVMRLYGIQGTHPYDIHVELAGLFVDTGEVAHTARIES